MEVTEKKKQEKETAVEEFKFTKMQILSSTKYARYKDVLGALLEERLYTTKEVDVLFANFMKGKVE